MYMCVGVAEAREEVPAAGMGAAAIIFGMFLLHSQVQNHFPLKLHQLSVTLAALAALGYFALGFCLPWSMFLAPQIGSQLNIHHTCPVPAFQQFVINPSPTTDSGTSHWETCRGKTSVWLCLALKRSHMRLKLWLEDGKFS